jgi:outer membrane protein OmpA-like peptidoglycan-associated protein
MMNELGSLANQGLEIFQIPATFNGFLSDVFEKLKKLDKLSWTQSEYELLGESAKEQLETLIFLVKSEVEDLKKTCKIEIATFLKSDARIVIPDEWVEKLEDPDQGPIIYASKDFINPIEFTFDETLSAEELNTENDLSHQFEKVEAKKKKRKKKDQFSQDVLALLQQNSDQLISIQRELLEIRKENILRDEDNKNESIEEIANLQVQIDELKKVIYNGKRTPKELRVYENAKEEVYVIYFNKNSKDLSEKYKVELNTILSRLIKNPSLKIMITGFADKSGDPDYNALLSKKRALGVRNYLYIKGIVKKRMLMNYLGDISSASENANDRRVEIEFINEIGHLQLSAN